MALNLIIVLLVLLTSSVPLFNTYVLLLRSIAAACVAAVCTTVYYSPYCWYGVRDDKLSSSVLCTEINARLQVLTCYY